MKKIMDTYEPVISEVGLRPLRISKIPIIDIPPQKFNKSNLLTSPGTVTVYIANKGSKLLEQVRLAAKEGGKRIEELRRQIDDQIKNTKSSSRSEFIKLMIQQPVLAEIRYGGATLNHGFFLPEKVDLFPIPFAYIGGSLAQEGFNLVEYYKEGSDAALEALAIRSEPLLTDAEKEAISLLPSNELSRNVAPLADWCDTTWWVIAAAVVAAAHVTVEATCICFAMENIHLSDDQIKKLGPAASARQLMGLRRQVLQKSLAK